LAAIATEAIRVTLQACDRTTSHPLFGNVWINRERLSGAPCFYGTRVPIQNLFDYLEGGEPLDDFLDGFPGVTREQAVAVLELAVNGLLAELPKP
jgi:uncharacterized protein (DUF433 family)